MLTKSGLEVATFWYIMIVNLFFNPMLLHLQVLYSLQSLRVNDSLTLNSFQ